jgi:hypothetical protein
VLALVKDSDGGDEERYTCIPLDNRSLPWRTGAKTVVKKKEGERSVCVRVCACVCVGGGGHLQGEEKKRETTMQNQHIYIVCAYVHFICTTYRMMCALLT